jgi:tetratricopeptide (TPR) repeat protein
MRWSKSSSVSRNIAAGVVGSGLLLASAAMAQATAATVVKPATGTDRSGSYYHYGLAKIYEDLATSQGRSDYATQAIEEYKLALTADPDSTFLQDGMAELYFKVGRIREAVQVAQDQIKKNPNDIDAHTLLARIYYRSLGNLQNSAQTQMVQLATVEYETLVRLQPNNVENHLLLGQLYEIAHDSGKAEAQFKAAQGLDSNSEEALLNMARLYSEQGDIQRVVTTLSSLPVTDRTARIEFALGASYDQLKQPKKAAEAYQRAVDIEADNVDAQRGLANALLADGQMDKALKQFQDIVAAEPQDAQSYVRIAEIQRRQGHYEDALATLKKAKALVPDSEELTFNEALTLDALGRYDEAEKALADRLTAAAKADNSYTDAERSNRAIFLDRLGLLYREQNKTQQAVEIYGQMIALGGDFAPRGYQGQVDSYRDAHDMAKATAVADSAYKALPKDRDIQRMYAGQLADTGKGDQGVAMIKALLNGKDDRDTYLTLAQVDVRLKRWADASAALDKAEAITLKPEDKLYIYFLRGTLADRQKQYDAAEVQFRKVLSLDANNAQALNYLGYMLADHNLKLQESVSLLKKAVELDPQNGSYLDSLGWAYFKTSQYAQAEDLLVKAQNRLPTEAAIHDHLGEVYEKQGKLKLAAAQWERAVAEYARTPAADVDSEDVARVHRKLDTVRVRIAKVRTTP